MSRPESQIRYIAKYKKLHITKVSIEFNKGHPEDMELLKFLNAQEPSKQGFIKNLLRQAMNNSKK